MNLAFIPVYIYYLGMEAYGLIGVFVSLQAWLVLLDMGITPMLNREMARFEGGAHDTQEISDLLRTLEFIYLPMAILIVVGIAITAHWLATHWLNAEKIPIASVTQALIIMGFVVALRWFTGLYRGAIMGLQHQVWFNGNNAVFATLRNAGVVIILAWVSPTIDAFFIYQAIIAAMESLVLAIKTRRLLPTPPRPAKFSVEMLQKTWRFAAGMTGIAFLAILLTQIDKIILSKMVSLTTFGYYILAVTLASGLRVFVTPISSGILPRLTELVSLGDEKNMSQLYHKSTQLLAITIIPITCVLSLYSEDVLLIWTRDPVIAESVAPLLSILVIGTMLNGLMTMPYMLQLAHGWTRLAINVNLASIFILLPAVYIGVHHYGAIAAAVAWLMLNIGYLLITISLMHRVLLQSEKWRWYSQAVIWPALPAIIICLLFYKIVPDTTLENLLPNALILILIMLISIASSALFTPLGRGYFKMKFNC